MPNSKIEIVWKWAIILQNPIDFEIVDERGRMVLECYTSFWETIDLNSGERLF